MRLLLIEDDPQLGKALYQGLRQEYAADWFRTAEEGSSVIASTAYDVLVLDINLPGMSGLEWLQKLRRAKSNIPVLLLTARDLTIQRVEGLDAGADDYLIKPFDFDELLARIRALLRRKASYQDDIIQHKSLSIDVVGKTVTKDGSLIVLSSKEFEILRLLLENKGRCFSKDQIENKIYNWDDDFESNTVEVFVSSLRRKLGKDLIKTMRGIGYIIEREK